ncbi:MAG: penicillin acylase family protein [Candidatus Binataceae bacterium]
MVSVKRFARWRISTLVAVAAMLAAAWRPIPSNAATVTITRDSYGVPHIDDPSLLDTIYGLGYAAAEDRLWQMEVFRRAGAGRLSEILGSSYLLMDEQTRRDGYTTPELQAMYDALPPAFKQEADAFVAGVNAYIAVADADPIDKMPVELVGLGITPQPWQGADVAAAAVLGIRMFGVGGGGEVDNAALYLQLLNEGLSVKQARGVFNDFIWMRDNSAPTTIPEAAAKFVFPPPGAIHRFNRKQMAAVSRYAASIEAADVVLNAGNAAAARAERQLGLPVAGVGHSNALAVSGALTATGKPLLLGGPQTGIPVPSFWYEIGVNTTGYSGAGVSSLFGPGFVIGRTNDGAWSITSGESDDTDTYIEFLNPSNPNQYQSGTRHGHPVYSDMDCRSETYNVLGSSPVTQQVCRTAHGKGKNRMECPVFYIDTNAGVAFSRCFATWNQEFNSAVDLVQLGMTKNLADFESMLPPIAANLNLTYADKEGNIAFFHNGFFPIRPRGIDPRFPLLGGGRQEWKGYLPPALRPHVVNPAQGWLTNWNTSPAFGWSALEQREKWGAEDRSQGIADIVRRKIANRTNFTIDDMNEINFEVAQKDVFASRSIPYLEDAVATVPSADPDYAALTESAALIEIWLNDTASAQLYRVADGTPFTATVGGLGNALPLIYPPLTAAGTPCPNFDCNYADPGLQLYDLWRIQLQHDLFDNLLGARNRQIDYINALGSEENDHANDLSKDSVLLHLLEGRKAGIPPSCDYFNNCAPVNRKTYDADRDNFLVNTLREVIAQLAAQGLTPDQAADPVVTETFNSESVMPELTINSMNRGAFGMIVSLDGGIESYDVVPPGESEFVNFATAGENLSDPSVTDPLHITDQLQLYSNFQYKPLTIDATGPTTSETIPVMLSGSAPPH